MDYKTSGVDIEAGNETVRRIRGLARSTFTSSVLSDIGSFGGLFRIEPGRYTDPVLVSSADGVGTKLKVAFLANRHDTVGADLVNHCVNDILVQGAEPLFFLDYLATGRLSPAVAEAIVSGMAGACRDNGCALLGGETAEMPGFYSDGEYDIAGFIVGAVDRQRLLTGRTIVPGDALVGVPSTGPHSNGYTLARRALLADGGLSLDDRPSELGGASVADALLEPTAIYVRAVLELLASDVPVHGLAHITGGGLDNLSRLHAGVDYRLEDALPAPPIFGLVQRLGGVPDDEMWRVFNMGCGFIAVVPAGAAAEAASLLGAHHPGARRIGSVVARG